MPIQRDQIRAAIASRRDRPYLRVATRVASVTLRATQNVFNWDVEFNGEMFALDTALSRYDGDVFDVGSNVGQWASAAVRHVSGQRLIHCFEAVPTTHDLLERELAGHDGVKLNQVALGSEIGTITLNHVPTSSDRSSRYAIPDLPAGLNTELLQVPVTTGDEYCRTNGVERIAFLKIDVEGMEYEALLGFQEMLTQQRVSMLQFEYGRGYIHARRYLKDVAELLSDSGYVLYREYPNELEPFVYTEADEDFLGRNYAAELA